MPKVSVQVKTGLSLDVIDPNDGQRDQEYGLWVWIDGVLSAGNDGFRSQQAADQFLVAVVLDLIT